MVFCCVLDPEWLKDGANPPVRIYILDTDVDIDNAFFANMQIERLKGETPSSE